jgi:superfamily II DNA or RNA helicase
VFGIGQWVIDNVNNTRVQVLEKYDLWGYVSYRVYAPSSKEAYTLAGDCLRPLDNTELDTAFVRFIAVLAKVKEYLAGGMLSDLSENVLPLPHQRYAVDRALSGSRIRYLLADEVGLGKTIEAGLIIRELKARGLIKRILVVCPKGLVTQWYTEMKDKFNERFNIILPEDYDTIRRLTDTANVYEGFDQVISPMDSIKPIEKRAGWDDEKINKYNNERIVSIVNGGWDLIVIDEAHRVAGSTGDVARYRMASLLSKASPYLLLLTATPHSGKTEPFLRLVRLLDEQAFPDYRAIVKEQVAPYIIRTEKREAVDNEGKKLFKDRITKTVHIKWQQRHSLQKELYRLVSRYVAYGYNRAVKEKKYYIGFLMVLMQRLVSSSTAAIRDSIEKRISILENQQTQIAGITIEDMAETDTQALLEILLSEAALDLKWELNELHNILSVAKQAQFQYSDAKAENLVDLLDGLRSKEDRRIVIIFTEFVATQEYLKDFLERRGFSCSILNGSMDIEQRNAAIDEFRTKTDILISTDAGGEGINLQFASVVINYDLPWNPMKIEQRIGRVDRIGQSRDVLVYNYVLEDTVEKRVREVLEQKLSVIMEQMGIDKMQDVLDSELAEADFTDVYIKSVANPNLSSFLVEKLEEDIKGQVAQAMEIRDLIKDDKELQLHRQQDIDRQRVSELLRFMYVNYKASKGEIAEVLEETVYSIGSSEIRTIIEQQSYWQKNDGAVIINIPGLSNEAGYWSVWELSVGPDERDKSIIPVFINTDGVSRPASAIRIWDEIIKPGRDIEVRGTKPIGDSEYDRIYQLAKDIAYDRFVEIGSRYRERNQAEYKKYLFALETRLQAAQRIGIDNIRKRRIEDINKEKERMQANYMHKVNPCPVFKPLFMAFME